MSEQTDAPRDVSTTSLITGVAATQMALARLAVLCGKDSELRDALERLSQSIETTGMDTIVNGKPRKVTKAEDPELIRGLTQQITSIQINIDKSNTKI